MEPLTAVVDRPEPAREPGGVPAETQAALDGALTELHAHRGAWVSTGIPERIGMLEQIGRDMLPLADAWVAACVADKEIGHMPWAAGFEWAMFANVFRYLRLLRHSLAGIERHGRPSVPGRIYQRPDGQTVAGVFPQTLYDRALFPGVSGEVWMEPGVTPEEATATQARIYHARDQSGGVCLVLGGGNASMIPALDSLQKLFVEEQVVLLKLSPVNAYLAPLIQTGLQTLIRRGFLRVVTGGADEGEHLCRHRLVDAIHMTGSDKTFAAITFGPGEEGARRKAARTPLLQKALTAELGNVGPLIVVPGAWSEREIGEMAEQIATWLALNAGSICATPRVLITHRGWAQRGALLSAIGHVLDRVTTCKAFYPGARQRYDAFLAAHPDAHRHGTEVHNRLPWTLIQGVDASRQDDICFTTESFCSVYAETQLPAPDPASFLDAAVDFANNVLWGTLSANIVVHPGSLHDPRLAAALERGVAGLRYGTVAVNLGLTYAYYMMLGPWGAYPGASPYDVQSGIGHIHNLLMFDRPQKTVYRAPFTKLADPIRVTHRHTHEFGRALAAFDAEPSLPGMARVGASVLRR